MSKRRDIAKRYGHWAVVTGASDGTGRAFALYLAAEGVTIVLAARRQPLLQRLAEELEERYGVQCQVFAADLADPEAVARLAESTAELGAGLLVAATGVGTSGLLLASQARVETDMVELNCTTTLLLAWHFGQRVTRRV